MKDWLKFALSIMVLFSLDATWIWLNLNMYKHNIQTIQNSEMKIKIIPSIISYVLLIGVVLFCSFNKKEIWWHNTIQGAILGLFIYGIYNATNKATLDNYSTKVSVLDTFWGTFLMAVVASINSIEY